MTHTEKLFAGAIAVLLVGLFAYAILQKDPVYGSVETGQEYNATTTGSIQLPAERNLKTGSGALGSVVITGALSGGKLTLYNATTSDVNKRTGQKATSTIVLADFPIGYSVGTYTFDASFSDGLLLITSASPTAPTSTITWR